MTPDPALEDPQAIDLGAASALVLAAIEGHDQEAAIDQARFFGSAARGRPEVRRGVGRTVEVRMHGHGYRFRVRHLAPGHYRLDVDGTPISALVEKSGPNDRRLRAWGAWQPLRITPVDDGFRVEADDRVFDILRDDGGVVTAPAPAVVIATRVGPGAAVRAGDPLVVLEAMKMEMTVAAPTDGRVRHVLISTGMQVGTGTPLVRLVAREEDRSVHSPRVRFPVRPMDPADDPGFGSSLPPSPCSKTLQDLLRLVLGYDLEPVEAGRLGEEWATRCRESSLAEAALRREEDRVLAVFADVVSLSGPFPSADGRQPKPAGTDLLAYLRTLDARQESLSPAFVTTLRRALARHGVESTERSPALEEAVWRIYRAHDDVERVAPAIAAILDRRLESDAGRTGDASGAEDGLRELLDRIALALRHRNPRLADLAREVRFRTFDQPVIAEARAQIAAEARAHIEALTDGHRTQEQAGHMAALVDHPHPIKDLVIEQVATAKIDRQGSLLEALVRRYYRIRALQAVRTEVLGKRAVVTAEYDHEGRRINVVAAYADRSELLLAVADLLPAIQRIPDGADVVLDLYLRREGPPADADREADALRADLDAAGFPRPLRRVVIAMSGPGSGPSSARAEHFTFRPSAEGYREDVLYRGLHPMIGKRLDLWRLSRFDIQPLASGEDVHLFHGVARENPSDERLFALAEVRDLTPVRDADGRVTALPELEQILTEALEAIRTVQSHRADADRIQYNRVLMYLWPPLLLTPDELSGVVHRLAPLTEGLGLEKVVVRGRMADPATRTLRERVLHVSNPFGKGLVMRFGEPAERPISTLSEYQRKVVQARQRGLVYPYEIVAMLTPSGEDPGADVPPGEFDEYDLDAGGELVRVERPFGENSASIVTGVIRNRTDAYPEGMTRVMVLGDPSRSLGSLAEPECRRIMAALDLAERLRVPLDWFAISAGARISRDSGTENMDWIGRVLRRLIEFTQGGGEVNVVVTGINVGAQPYWNAEATMLMHTRGILIMTPDSAMVLTGKQALDYSGGVSADDNFGIGGYDRVMGPNGQAQYWAPDLGEACRVLLHHHRCTYVAPAERFPRRVLTTDPPERDVRSSPHRLDRGWTFRTVGDIFDEATNPGRKKPFDIRSVMRAVSDADHNPLERWADMRDADIAVVWDAQLGGHPVCLIGLESHPLPRHGPAPADGPEHWTSGTLFPLASKKVARAINAASGSRPLVVLANLSGFDGSPESMRGLQLEYGAEIGRAVVNFRGPIVFVVISRYHGGAFVVFSQTLNEAIEVAAVEGSFASVIGGAPAAAVVFARDVEARTKEDPRVKAAHEALAAAPAEERVALRREADELTTAVRSEKISEVAAEFDAIHSIQRALEVGSVHRIIEARLLRPYLIEAVERGIRRELEGVAGQEPVPVGRQP